MSQAKTSISARKYHLKLSRCIRFYAYIDLDDLIEQSLRQTRDYLVSNRAKQNEFFENVEAPADYEEIDLSPYQKKSIEFIRLK